MESNEHRGTLALIFGVLAILGGNVLFGIPAWILGGQVVNEYSPAHPQYGLANAGKILGIVSVALSLLGFIVAFVIIAFFGGLALLGAAFGG